MFPHPWPQSLAGPQFPPRRRSGGRGPRGRYWRWFVEAKVCLVAGGYRKKHHAERQVLHDRRRCPGTHSGDQSFGRLCSHRPVGRSDVSRPPISMGMNSIGRLKPGVTFAQARADMDSVAQNLAAAYPDADKGTGITLVPLKTDVVGEVRGILLVLLGAVGFVLLIACANVANLLLARSTGRTREFAIRSALVASPARALRQSLTQSVILGVAGG